MSKEKKIIAAKKAFEYIEEGMKLGLGTGSTADEFTKVLSENVKDGFEIICIPTSENTKKLAELYTDVLQIKRTGWENVLKAKAKRAEKEKQNG